MDDWFYELNGRQAGPVSKGELVSLLVAGTITPSTLVWNKKLSDWTEISSLDDDFNSSASVETTLAEAESKALFLYIPISRLILMNTLSMGFYQVYWIYHNWRFLKQQGYPNIRPFWRAFFSLFFIYPLFKEIHSNSAANERLKPLFAAGPLAACLIITTTFSIVLSRPDDITVNLIGLALTLLNVLLLLPVQTYINAVNQTLPNPPAYYNKWSLGHVICLILGSIIWIALLIRAFA